MELSLSWKFELNRTRNRFLKIKVLEKITECTVSFFFVCLASRTAGMLSFMRMPKKVCVKKWMHPHICTRTHTHDCLETYKRDQNVPLVIEFVGLDLRGTCVKRGFFLATDQPFLHDHRFQVLCPRWVVEIPFRVPGLACLPSSGYSQPKDQKWLPVMKDSLLDRYLAWAWLVSRVWRLRLLRWVHLGSLFRTDKSLKSSWSEFCDVTGVFRPYSVWSSKMVQRGLSEMRSSSRSRLPANFKTVWWVLTTFFFFFFFW